MGRWATRAFIPSAGTAQLKGLAQVQAKPVGD